MTHTGYKKVFVPPTDESFEVKNYQPDRDGRAERKRVAMGRKSLLKSITYVRRFNVEDK